MASSELSSSEINQGQGFYHDGKNEAAGLPPLPSPLSPAQVALEPEQGFWKKYSSHYEFPLSLVIAIGIHVIVVLFVVAFMTLNFYWAQPKQHEIDLVTLEPRFNDDNNPTDKPKPGGHTGEDGIHSRDLFVSPFNPLDLARVPDSIVPPDHLTDPLSIIPSKPTPLDKLQTARQGLEGPKGRGTGGISGDNIGPGDGIGSPMARNKRWRIQFNYDEPEAFLAQMANLQLTVAGRLNNGRYLVYKQLKAGFPSHYDEMTDTAFASFVNEAKLLWFMSTDRTTCDNFALAVNSSERLLTLIMLVPRDLEQAILTSELNHHKMTEDEIRARKLYTSFRIVKEASGWKVTVTRSEVMK